MLQTLLQNIVVTVATVMLSAQPTTVTVQPTPVPQDRMYMVAEGEFLSQIAEKQYGNEDAWAIIIKDNPQLQNPNVLEKGTKLKLRIATPSAEEIQKSVPVAMHDSIVLEATPELVPTTIPVVEVTPVIDPVTATAGPLSEEQLTYLGNCEAGMDPTKNTGNGYYGAFQFSYGTWKSMNTGFERADMAPIEVQKDAVQRLLSRSSIFTQFPGCAKKMQALGMM